MSHTAAIEIPIPYLYILIPCVKLPRQTTSASFEYMPGNFPGPEQNYGHLDEHYRQANEMQGPR